jgi:predicted permease
MHFAELQDLRYAIRTLLRNRSFTTVAVLTLALGMGANTAIFSVVSGVLLRPLPFPAPDRLVELNEAQPWAANGPVTIRDMVEWRTRSNSLIGLAGFYRTSKNLQNVAEPEQVAAIQTERELFQVLGVQAFAGRTFRADDPDNVLIVSSGFWKRRLGTDPAAIGRTITLDGAPFTVIGILPDDFQFPYQATATDFWLPWRANANSNGRTDRLVARLKPGVSLEAARSELSSMSERAQPGRVVRIAPLADVISKKIRQSLLVLMGAVGMVLLVACVNVANLLLARGAARAQEIAIRSALGAGRWRLIRQFLAESLLLAAAGGSAGLIIGVWGGRLLAQSAAAEIPRAAEIGFDWRVFLYLLAASLATGVAFGFAPAVAAVRAGSAALKTRSLRSPLRDGLVVAEVALAFVLLAGAGLMVRTFLNLQHTDSGVDPNGVLTLHVVASGGPELAAMEERVLRVPGVCAAGFISLLPLQNSGWTGYTTVLGRPGRFETELRYVTPGYFEAMGVHLRRGRTFTPRDTGNKLAVVINEALARQVFPNEDPIGKQLDRGTIVGLVADVHQAALDRPAVPEVFFTVAQNFAQLRSTGTTLVVRGQASGMALGAAIREVNPNQAVFSVHNMTDVVSESLASQRLYLSLLGLFAALGTALAAAGIYGVIAYLVTVRTREFGIRMALGADPFQVVGLVIGRGSVLVGVGLVLGAAGAAAFTRLLKKVLFGVGTTDPTTYAAMAAALALVALAACMVPARRASKVNPSVALRAE